MPCQGTGGSHGRLHACRQGLSRPCPCLVPLSAARPRWSHHTGCTHTLRSSAEAALQGAALPLKTRGGGQPPLHHVPWPRMGLGQLRAVLVGNLCPWEQCSLGGGGERTPGAWNRPGLKSWVHATPVAKGSVWLS